ncbi:MAG TPA: DUF4907 domain-containing protein [Puia sp.]|nr:DUF4907 domain-containing protein [Puia sp.]
MTKKKSFKKGLLYGLIVIVAGVLVYFTYQERVKWKKEHVLVELRPIQLPQGWGYDILANGKVFIHQPTIPAIPGQHTFRTKEDALAVGQKVVDRITQGQMPMVTTEEVKAMGLAPDSATVPKRLPSIK